MCPGSIQAGAYLYLEVKMKIYIFVKYPHDTRWFRSRALLGAWQILQYVKSLGNDPQIRISVR
jgi:hypothetical protein